MQRRDLSACNICVSGYIDDESYDARHSQAHLLQLIESHFEEVSTYTSIVRTSRAPET